MVSVFYLFKKTVKIGALYLIKDGKIKENHCN